MTSLAKDSHEKLEIATLNISEGGYLYVYVSNESDTNFDVFFDDLRITHAKGNILQEDHYYPFGMAISALSSSAPLSRPNEFKYGGKELQSDFNMDWYDYGARMYNSKIGRWNHIDPLSDIYQSYSPFNYTLNNPIRYIDPNGMNVTETDSSFVFDGEDVANILSLLNAGAGSGGCDPQKDTDCGKEQKDTNVNSSEGKGYDAAGIMNYLNNISAYSMGKGIESGIDLVYYHQLLKQWRGVTIMNSYGATEIVEWKPEKMSKFIINSSENLKGIFEKAGIAGDVLITLYNVKEFANGDMSAGRFAYNVVGTGTSAYVGYAVGGPAGIAVGTLFLGIEGAYDSIQRTNAIIQRNTTPKNRISSWDQFKRRLNDFMNWYPR